MIQRPPAPTPDHPSASRPLGPSLLALGAGFVAAATIPGQPPGVNVVLTALLVGVAVLAAIHRELAWSDLALGGLAFALIATFAFRSAEWVLALNLLAAAGVATVAVARTHDWSEMVGAVLLVIARFHRGVGFVLRPVFWRLGEGRKHEPELFPLARGLLLGVVLAVIFGTLFVSADAAFAHLAHDALVPGWDLSLIPARIIVGSLVVTLVGAYVLASPRYAATIALPSSLLERRLTLRRKLKKAEWLPALLSLDVVFASFVIVQLTVLFGGRDHVLSTAGLTYAQYARQGFFQLLMVAGLTLAVIAASVGFSDLTRRRDRRLMQAVLGVLCALTLVILASAFKRLNLYEHTYGFTRLRVSVHFTIVYLAGIFVMVVAAGAMWRSRWLPRALVTFTAVSLLAFSAMDPERLIARRNVDRYSATGRIDSFYLATLSADAVPELVRLPEPLRSCVLSPIEADLDETPSSWSFNLSRVRALETLAPVRDSLEVEDLGSCY